MLLSMAYFGTIIDLCIMKGVGPHPLSPALYKPTMNQKYVTNKPYNE